MLQGQEILVILLVALVVLGPQRLPEVARKVGSWTNELRRAARDIRSGLEAEVGDLRGVADDFKAPLKEVNETMTDLRKAADDATRPTPWVGPEPTKGPKPSDSMRDLNEIEETGQSLSDRPADGESGATG